MMIEFPGWVRPLAKSLFSLDSWWRPGPEGERQAAVLILLSQTDVPDLVLTVRAANLSHHAGQISLPGGGREPDDDSPAVTALREASEEIGLAFDQVRPLGQLEVRGVPVSRNTIVPVVGLWSGNDAISAFDPDEVDTVVRWSLRDLADPAHRVTARHPHGGTGPAWDKDGLFLWGFTAFVVDALLQVGGVGAAVGHRPCRRCAAALPTRLAAPPVD